MLNIHSLKNLFSFITLILCFFFSVITTNAQSPWEELPNVPQKLVFPIVTVLGDNIHVINATQEGANNAHFRYNTITNSWDTLASLPYAAQMAAGDAADGKIHVFGGGYPHSGYPLDSHYVYFPETNSWENATNLDPARAIHKGKSIEGQVYAIAGQGVLTRFEKYNTETEAWEEQENLPDTRFAYSSITEHEGKLYRFGGGGYTSPYNYANVYDPSTDAWTSLPNLPNVLHAGAATGIDGTSEIYIVGGYHSFAERKEVWVFDTATETYTEGPELPVGRNYHEIVTVNGCIYSLGGNHAIEELGASMVRLCPASLTIDETHNSLEKINLTNTSEELIVELSNEINANVNIAITDLSGRILFEKNNLKSTEVIPTQKWATTVLFVKLYTQNEQIVKKIVRQ